MRFGRWRLVFSSFGVLSADIGTACIGLKRAERTCLVNSSTSQRRLVEIPPGQIISGSAESKFDGLAGVVQAMLYSLTEDLLFVGGQRGVVQFWRGSDLEQLPGGAAGGVVNAIVYVPEERLIVVAREDGVLIFLQVRDRAIKKEVLENPGNAVVTALEHLEYEDDVQSYTEVASASADRTIKLWSARGTGEQPSRVLEGHQRPVLTLRFLRPLAVLASGGFDGLVGFWFLPRATRLAVGKRCKGRKTFLSIAFRESDCLAAAEREGGKYFIFGLPGGQSANSCELELDGCTELQDGAYTLYRLETSKRFLVPGHRGVVRALEYVPDTQAAASAGDDGHVRLWDPTTGQAMGTAASVVDRITGGPEPVVALLYISGLRALVAGTAQRLIFLDALSGDHLKTIARSFGSTALVHLAPHGLIAATESETVSTWRLLDSCMDGQRPKTAASCEPCPGNLAGYGGFCQVLCPSGASSSADRTTCEPCAPGRGGTDGFCDACVRGRYQDTAGRVSCKRCRKGTAQPNEGQDSCVPCVDNTAAQIVGQERCEECPDGTEPFVDNTRCVQCPQGKAGQRGVCFGCGDGEQPNDDLSRCILCTPGTAGLGGTCELCRDGTQPAADKTICEPCPEAFAGTKGFCTRCQPGQEPASDRSFCRSCPPGQAGESGTCSSCASGYVPDQFRTRCDECPGSQPSILGVCTDCADGTYPAADRTQCLPCPRGWAGRKGRCAMCPHGFEADEASRECLPCDASEVSHVGVCEQCPNGTQPNVNQSACELCLVGRAGTFGRCLACPDGAQQDLNRSFCEPCLIGSAGRGGVCRSCPHPLMQTADRTECALQALPPTYLFRNARCTSHPSCVAHFEHELALATEVFFCCPAEDGNLLACCEFESPAVEFVFETVTAIMESGLLVLLRTVYIAPVISLMGFFLMLGVLRRMRGESWEDWWDEHSFSKAAYAVTPLLLASTTAIFPWLLATAVTVAWMPAFAAFVVGRVSRFSYWTEFCSHGSRARAMKSLRPWLVLFFAADVAISLLHVVQVVFTTRVIFVDVCTTMGVKWVKQLPFEYVTYGLPLPHMVQEGIRFYLRFVRVPETAIANIVVHVDHHATNMGTTLLLVGMLAFGFASVSYVMLVGNVFGRLAAARESVLLAKMPGQWRLRRLAFLGFVDLVLSVALHVTCVVPARLLPLVVQTARRHSLPSSVFEAYGVGSIALYVLVIQLLIFCMWASTAGGHQIENPPALVSKLLRRFVEFPFDAQRRETFIARAILQALELIEERDDENGPGLGSPSSSPRSARSNRSPRGSPRSTTAGNGRSPRGTGGSPRGTGGSPRGTGRSGRRVDRRNPRSRGGSPRTNVGSAPASARNNVTRYVIARPSGSDSPRSGAGSFGSPRSAGKLEKNLASATKAIARLAGVGSTRSPRGLSAREGDTSTVRSQIARVDGRQRLRFVRMPDGTRISLMEAVGERGSPRDFMSSRSPGQSPRFYSSHGRGGSRSASPSGSPRGNVGTDVFEDSASPDLSGKARFRRRVKMLTSAMLRFLTSWLLPSRLANRNGNVPGDGHADFITGFARVEHLLNQPAMSKDEIQELLALSTWEDVAGTGDVPNLDLLNLRMSPQVLFNRVPSAAVKLGFISAAWSIMTALRTSFCTCLGHWKHSWNFGPHRVRVRTRDLMAGACRTHFDKYDYGAVEQATGKTVATAQMLIPGGHLLYSFAKYCNSPPLRVLDDSLDILKLKIDELVDRGVAFKQAEASLKRAQYRQSFDIAKELWARHFLRIQKLLGLLIVVSQLTAGVVLTVENSETLGTLVFMVVIVCLLLHSFIEFLVLPFLVLSTHLRLSVTFETEEEKKIRAKIGDLLVDSESDATDDDSSDYSSANESFLDEDPESEARPSVMGVKNAKVLVRPKAMRLQLRFVLQRSTKEVSQHCELWRREAIEKHGRLMHLKGDFLKFSDYFRTVSFTPTGNSDWEGKVRTFGLTRSRSLGTVTAEELVERRLDAERWAGFADIFEETCRPGVPSMPHTTESIPERGLVDDFEALRIFRSPPAELTNRQLWLMNPLHDTALAQHLRALTGAEAEKPWERSFDEERAAAQKHQSKAGAMYQGLPVRESLHSESSREDQRHHAEREDVPESTKGDRRHDRARSSDESEASSDDRGESSRDGVGSSEG